MDDETVAGLSEPDQAPQAEPGPSSGEIVALRGQLDEAIAAYRDALLASEPLIDEALVTGATAADVRASFDAAMIQVGRVRDALRREQAAAVPAGAPGRSPEPPASAFEKIRRGLEQLRR